jgi:hypothetical protein
MDIEKVFLEVKRVLAPGGVFVFLEEPIRRKLSLRLYRCPYQGQMKPWEKLLYNWGLLGYVVKDVIGARQEDNFGILQNHRMTLNHWDALIRSHFVARELEISTADRGWGEHGVHVLARRLDRLRSEWLPAKLLGGTLAAMCRKGGDARRDFEPVQNLAAYLRCPDCQGAIRQDTGDVLGCDACGYEARAAEEVYNLLPSTDRKELYPGDRLDTVDFAAESHSKHLLDGWYEVEGAYGGKYRWMGPRASVWLARLRTGPQRLRVRGHLHELSFTRERTVRIELAVNGEVVSRHSLDRPGLFIIEADVADAEKYQLEIQVTPAFTAPPDVRPISARISMIRLIPRP